MSTLLNQDTTLIIQKDGLYTYKVENISHLTFEVEANVTAQIIFELGGMLDLDIKTKIEDSSNVRILHINKCEKSVVSANYYVQEAASLVLGFYELHNKEAKQQIKVHLEKPFAQVDVISTSLSRNIKHYDIECIHYVHDTYSDMKNYEISDEGANYKIIASGNIKKGAYGSKSHQINRVLTLSEKQKSQAIPLLLIEENDVEASHANTMGKMAEEDLFYLQSRGISEESAKGLLILSYVLPIADVIEDEAWHEKLIEDIRSKVGL